MLALYTLLDFYYYRTMCPAKTCNRRYIESSTGADNHQHTGAAVNAHTCHQLLDIADYRHIGSDRTLDVRLTKDSFRMQMDAIVS